MRVRNSAGSGEVPQLGANHRELLHPMAGGDAGAFPPQGGRGGPRGGPPPMEGGRLGGRSSLPQEVDRWQRAPAGPPGTPFPACLLSSSKEACAGLLSMGLTGCEVC